MPRTFRSDYADQAFLRFCAKRDRENKVKGGDRANGHPLHNPKSSPITSTDPTAARQLEDAEWFEQFPRAHVRLRELREDDGHSQASRELLLLAVTKSGSRVFLYKWAGAHLQ